MSLTVSNLNARYGRIEVCRDLNLSAPAGEVLVMLGPNGAGKSTTLGAIAGSVSSSGSVRVDGRELSGRPAHGRAGMGLALVPEGRRNLIGKLTVRDNLLLGLRLLAKGERDSMMQDLLELFPFIDERMQQGASMLSGGEQQMLAIAMAMARKPKVLLLDEPSQGLAPVILDKLVTAISELRNRGLAILLAEQNVGFASRLGNRFVVLDQGEITQSGDGARLADRDLATAAMLGA